MLLRGPILGIGATAFRRGEYDHARALFEQALALAQEVGELANIALVLQYFATLAMAQGQPQRALSLAGAATALCASLHIDHIRMEPVEFAHIQTDARQMLTEEAAAAAWAAGRAMTLAQAIAYALAKPAS
jgi:hypothetical protein